MDRDFEKLIEETFTESDWSYFYHSDANEVVEKAFKAGYEAAEWSQECADLADEVNHGTIKELERLLFEYKRSNDFLAEDAENKLGSIKELEKRLADKDTTIEYATHTNQELEKKLVIALELLNEAAPIMEKIYLRKSWFDKVNQLND